VALAARPWNPRAQNVSAVVGNALQLAGAVRRIVGTGEVALVLGGDCTVGLGTVAGSLSSDRVGLIYFDLHADLNVPGSVEEGALDWMGMAHLLGEDGTVPELRDLGPRRPMLDDDQILLFGHDPKHATRRELESIERRSLSTIPIEVVAADPEDAGAVALEHAGGAWDRVLVHLDIDVVDFTDAPLSENTG
jgi:arginase